MNRLNNEREVFHDERALLVQTKVRVRREVRWMSATASCAVGIMVVAHVIIISMISA